MKKILVAVALASLVAFASPALAKDSNPTAKEVNSLKNCEQEFFLADEKQELMPELLRDRERGQGSSNPDDDHLRSYDFYEDPILGGTAIIK